ncbi:MAG: RNA polymerase sigma factor [Patescibacteria group bacterium]
MPLGLEKEYINLSDGELVTLALKDKDDFFYIVEKYKKKLRLYIKRMINVREGEVDDILQNVFIKVYLNLNDFDNKLSFSSWIYRIAHNEIIDNYRRFKARPQILDIDIRESNFKELRFDDDVLDKIIQEEKIEKINQAISSLNLKYQEVIILKFVEERDYKEIADIIKKPLGTVASRLNKAKKELIKILVQTNK